MSHKLQLRLGISLIALILLPSALAGYLLLSHAPPSLLDRLSEPPMLVAIVLFLVLTSAGLVFGTVTRQIFRPVVALQAWINAIASDDGIRVSSAHRRIIGQLLRRDDEVGCLANATLDMERQLVETKRKLANIAYYDALTGLANRHTFTLFLQKSLESAKRHNHSAALLYIDIDGFKDVNDTLGHGAGDGILKQIADRLNTVLRAEDYIADMSVHHDPLLIERENGGTQIGPRISRIGGDEFAVVIKQLDEVRHAILICERLLTAMKDRFTVDGHQFTLGASIGVSMYPADGNTDEDLLKCADIAMYHSKSSGRNTFNFYNENMEVVALEMHQLIADLQHAVENNEFYLQYQPQFSTLTGELVSLEALVRWQHPVKGFIPPNDFISLAESSGMIVELGRWVLMEACHMLARLHKEVGLEIRIAVNVSPVQFAADHGLIEAVRDALQATGLNGSCLDLEITESAIMQSGQVALETLQAMKALNVNVSMDDFGTGYSSLAALRDMPIDQLKIDKAFIDHILGGGREHSIIKAMLALAKELDIEVVAEGVETHAQLNFLKLLRCDLVQGYLMSKPLSEDNLFEFIRQHAESPVF